jgi:tRNA (guanine-N7-)-methyltransferase
MLIFSLLTSLVALGPAFPDRHIVGLELRKPVVDFVSDRLAELQLRNVGVLRANAMKHLSNHFGKGALQKLFFTFPDPHFKRANHRRRIVSSALVAEYAYVLAPGGHVYTITDVLDLHQWMCAHLDACPAFERISAQARAPPPFTS